MNNLDQMYYSRWASNEEMLNSYKVSLISDTSQIKTVGLPIGSISDKLIVDDSISSTMIIGGLGSGKTQSTILPMLYQATKSNESILVTDPKGELYQSMATEFEKNGFNVVYINLSKPEISDCWSPFTLAKHIYDSGKKDDAFRIVESTVGYLLCENNPGKDPFWENTATQYVTGIIISLLEAGVDLDKINFKTISKFTNNYESEDVIEYINSIDKNSIAYQFIASTHLAPFETKGSIMSVINQKLTIVNSREMLVSLLSKSNFDIMNIRKEKTAIFFTYDNTKSEECSFFNSFIEQVYYVLNYEKSTKPFNILLDDFDSNSVPLKNVVEIFSNFRSIYVRTVLCIKGFDVLNRVYGVEQVETLKYQFMNILYLMTNELKTLEFISEFCGKKNAEEYLVTPEALRRIPEWSCVLIKTRCLPYYGKLIPFYSIGIDIAKKEFNEKDLPLVSSIEI